eukprot:5900127-Prymnesium_polylepis.1
MEWKVPPSFLPTAAECACLYVECADSSIGELRVEILEARGLAIKDVASSDPYATIAFEASAARTCTVENSCDPKWSSRSARAFRFPIHKPYSTLYIALQDDDSS